MTFRGVLRGGKIELDPDVEFPEGTVFKVQPSRAKAKRGKKPAGAGGRSARRQPHVEVYRLAELAVSDRGLPVDLASELDHYVYNTPKRSSQQRDSSSRAKGSARPRPKPRKPAKRRGR